MALGLGTSIALASAGLSALGAISQGRAANKQAEFQAKVQEQQAQRNRDIAEVEEKDFRRSQSQLLAQRRAALGASGVEQGTGTPLLAAEDFAGETELQARRIRAGGNVGASRLEQQAGLTRAAGRSSQQRGLFRGGSSLLSGIGRAFE